MEQLWQATYSGVLYGSIYGLMALGLTLIWGSLRMLNLAHGAFSLVGGYLAWTLTEAAGLPILLALPLAVIGSALLGMVLQILLIKPMMGKPGWDSASLIATVGVAIAVESAVLLIFSPQVKQIPAVFPGDSKIGGVVVYHQHLLVIAVAVIFLFCMNRFLRLSRHGLAIRAVSQNMDSAQLMGVSMGTVFLVVMGTSAALAGMAGVLLSSIFYLSPMSGFMPMLKALVVTIFGGLGSIRGTIWAAYIIGFLESFVTVYVGVSWALPGLFLFMIVMLIIRPNGLFGLGEMKRL